MYQINVRPLCGRQFYVFGAQQGIYDQHFFYEIVFVVIWSHNKRLILPEEDFSEVFYFGQVTALH